MSSGTGYSFLCAVLGTACAESDSTIEFMMVGISETALVGSSKKPVNLVLPRPQSRSSCAEPATWVELGIPKTGRR